MVSFTRHLIGREESNLPECVDDIMEGCFLLLNVITYVKTRGDYSF
jgi:hypothetical protein